MTIRNFSAVIFLLALFNQQALCQNNAVVSATSSPLPFLPQTAQDMYAAKRAILNGFITELQKLSDDSLNTIEGFRKSTDLQATQFRQNSQSALTNLLTNLQQQIEKIINAGVQIPSNVLQCLNNQQNAATALVNSVTNDLGVCVNDVIKSIQAIIQRLVNIINQIQTSISTLVTQISNCGAANFQNFLQVGACLNNLIVNAQLNFGSFVVTIGAAVTELVTTVAGIPFNLAICSVKILPGGIQKLTEIISSISQCTVNAVTSG